MFERIYEIRELAAIPAQVKTHGHDVDHRALSGPAALAHLLRGRSHRVLGAVMSRVAGAAPYEPGLLSRC
ncbi:hypothetical protein ABT115_07920 [Streptomyces sp. NPDC001832]|uniref:hypothetical protein n=1 Tax=Streptomyces sp. NPDC001832 TaxID=3154527 RepID=UPI0033263827